MDKQYLNDEFDRFFEFPTEDKSHVSSVSAKLFAEHIAYPLEEYVAELEAKLEKYENLKPVAWVSTLDRLPPDKTVVLAVVDGRIRLAERRWEYPSYEEKFTAFWYWDDPNDDGQDWGISDVTHWMPIPLYALEK